MRNGFAKIAFIIFLAITLVMSHLAVFGIFAVKQVQAAGEVTFLVQDTNGNIITTFEYIINENNVGDPFSPNPADWPSLKPNASYSPVVAVGDNTDATVTLPDGKYLVSVLAPGHKLGGKHFTLPDDSGTIFILVQLVPHPLDLATIRIHVFHDNHPVNGEDDGVASLPIEPGLADFNIIIEDTAGEVTVDYFGNYLGTEYETNNTGAMIFDTDGNPVPVPGTGGLIVTDENGDAIIENLPPGKYEIQAIPRDSGWIQTTTIEGTHVIDAWVDEGHSGYSLREGFQTPMVWIGFVREMGFTSPGTGTITGRVMTTVEWTPPVSPLVLGDPVDRPYIALTDIGGNDEQVYLGRGNPDGTFTIENVPAGLYQMAIWDEPLDYIMSFRTVTVAEGQMIDMGEFGIPRWYGWIEGYVFYDTNGNTTMDPGEPGIAGEELATRFKDGSIQYTTVTDPNGYYEFPEVFELERFAVAEVGFGRFAATGASVRDEYDPNIVKSTHPGALTLAELTWAAKKNYIDWGKRAYGPGENGGISGIVYYATTRNELDTRYAAAEDYEPGIPGVTLNLYEALSDANGQPLYAPDGSVMTGAPIDTTVTDSWEHPFSCDVLDSQGNPLPDPLGLGPSCIEVPNISNEVKDGVFDGGYAFDGIPPGMYVVEVIPPDGYRVLAEEDVNTDQGDDYLNVPPPGPPEAFTLGPFRGPWTPPPLAGAMHTVNDPRSPFNGMEMPLGNRKLATVRDGLNAAADFFLFAEVPEPGRIVGFLLDDVNIETDPDFIYYGEKRGIPNSPVGIRDFTGRLIATVHSDANGVFEVLLPSTYSAHVPTPSGVVPGMYSVVGNDPGDPDNPNPNYNPNYQTSTRIFDVWPGKTTYADMAIFPITAFIGFPGAQFSQPPQCQVPAGTPQLWTVSQPYASPGDSFTINGTDFGAAQGSGTVTVDGLPLDISSWGNNTITVSIPGGFPTGPGQLVVMADNGEVTPTGLTFHVLGGQGNNKYDPTIITVDYDGTGDYESIQEAINAAKANKETLVVVYPGTYAENLIFYKGIKLQGVGAGGLNGVGGTVINGKFFAANAASWEALLGSINFGGNPEIPTGAAITIVGGPQTYKEKFNPQIDGFYITGARGEEGGALYVNAYADYLEISNNVIQSNGGGFGGALSLGKAYIGDNHNDNVYIHHNRILNNGGVSLAGGIGIFNGADNYEIAYNEICSNYSAEYGGGISHFGLSPGGKIHHNKILFNYAFDEGGGIFVGGEQPLTGELSEGSGEVDIYANLIQSNVSNDDSGGIRLLQPTTYRINIVNNMVVNNVATDIGGGVALDDASDVVIVNNTIAHNISTATAEDSDGLAHSAGLVSEGHSAAFLASLPPGSPDFSDPILFNNIFGNNTAYTWDGVQLVASGNIDLEVFGTAAIEYLDPNYCLLTVAYPNGASNVVGSDPLFVDPYDTLITAVAFRMEPDFITVIIVTVEAPEPGVVPGDYHILGGSSAIESGTSAFGGIAAPDVDIDDDARPQGVEYDIGADEYFSTP